MPKQNVSLNAFNRGIISTLALARTDLDRLRLSAEIQTNIIPRTLGSAMLRPGLAYTGARKDNNKTLSIDFVFSSTDLAEIELTDSVMRVWVDDAVVSRASVTASVTNGAFTSDLTGWTDDDESGAASTWETGGYLELLGTGTNFAKRYQEVTVNEASTEHALRIVIERGPVEIAVGTSAGDDTYHAATLKTGTHSLAFTPTGNFFIQFSSAKKYSVLVDSVAVESSGNLELPTPWGESDLPNIRWKQSADVIFLADGTYQQRRIERRNNNSWSVVLFEPEDGPFDLINISPISITPSAISGDITLTTNKDYWESDMVGELYRLVSSGQNVQASVSAENNFTNSIYVTGIGSSRQFTITTTGTWSATVTLQRSTDDATWVDVETYATNQGKTFNDGLDNVPYYYRIGIDTGDYTSGTVNLELSYSGGSLTGVARVTGYTSTTVVDAVVLSDLGADTATTSWYRSQWSDAQGWPGTTDLYEGRLWFVGIGRICGSVSDAYESFDDNVEGDSAPINRILDGPLDKANWVKGAQRLLIGTTLNEISCRSTSFDEPLTPSNFNAKDADTQGSFNVPPVKDGTKIIYVGRSGAKANQLQFSLEANDYTAADLSVLAPEVLQPSIVKVIIQQNPDTRIHFIRSDGKVAILVKDDAENTLAFVLFETGGVVEDGFVLPDSIEDAVYYTVARTINGSTVRYREKWALESEGIGGTNNKLADSFVYYSGTAVSTITGADHLEGEEVVLWGNGKDLGTYTVSSGSFTPSEAVTSYCYGLYYRGRYKSTKLAYAAGLGTALLQKKKLNQMGIIAQNIHKTGLKYGPSFDELYDIPDTVDYQEVADDTVHAEFDQETFPGAGHWSSDSRLCLQMEAPKPCTLLGCVMSIETNDKV